MSRLERDGSLSTLIPSSKVSNVSPNPYTVIIQLIATEWRDGGARQGLEIRTAQQ